ncbi:MAG: GldG family protein [Crenarchaeota archaeon]|nr:GldG family protein [Thermoproteota archaeon]MCR8453899.1 GldG family protein [Thermoproteota archaeon]MCR8455274.1 GldG family protein [Thermoproteota archaeon]MCR8463042.1 GldG family protein [Thermoproteota archaeon]MCR8470620.1 GldG family protein [Thermoproteota archaeon]
MRIAWDISHQEFTIEDHYYFSILKKELKNRNVEVFELEELNSILRENVDVLVLNYPEKSFDSNDLQVVQKFLAGGGKVIVLGYYKNEDHIADTINSLTKHFGLLLRADSVYDPVNNHNGDELFVVTSKVFHLNENVNKVLFPCAASVEILNEKATRLVEAEKTAKSSLGAEPVLMARLQFGEGFLILGGTCVFWDNYSITKYDNLAFSLNLLLR